MKTFDVPDWMIAPFVANGVSESDYFLYGAGRALGFVRMAAWALDETYSGQKIAEYHAYTGISAARTAIDATASWCNVVLKLGLKPSIQVSLTQKPFQKKVAQAQPELANYVQVLADLGEQIGKHREQAQHRDGLAIFHHMESQKAGHPGGWYLAISGDHTADLHLAKLLNCWADKIEKNLRGIHKVLVMTSDETQETEQLLAWFPKFNPSADIAYE